MGRLQRVDLRFDTPGLKRSSLIANITTALAQASTRLAAAAQFKFLGSSNQHQKGRGDYVDYMQSVFMKVLH